MVLSILDVLFTTLVVPRFTRLPSSRSILLSRYILIQIAYLALTTLCVGIVWLFPSQVLWIPGEKYRSLQKEVVFSILGSCLTLTAEASLSVSSSKGWIANPIIFISIAIISIITGIIVFDVKNIYAMPCLNIFIVIS